MKRPNFFCNANDVELLKEVLFERSTLIRILNVRIFLALKWFRRETNPEVIQAEIIEMEADFQNIQTDATKVTIRRSPNRLLMLSP